RQGLSARAGGAGGRGPQLVERHLHQSAQGGARLGASGRHGALRRALVPRRGRHAARHERGHGRRAALAVPHDRGRRGADADHADPDDRVPGAQADADPGAGQGRDRAHLAAGGRASAAGQDAARRSQVSRGQGRARSGARARSGQSGSAAAAQPGGARARGREAGVGGDREDWHRRQEGARRGDAAARRYDRGDAGARAREGEADHGAGVVRQLAVHAEGVGRLRVGVVPRVGGGATRRQARRRDDAHAARRGEADSRSLVRALPRGALMAFFDRFRVELGKYDDGVHDVGEPAGETQLQARTLPPGLGDFYRSWNGARLFADTIVIAPIGEAAWLDGGGVRIGEWPEGALELGGDGRVRSRDEEGAIVVGSTLEKFLAAVMAREGLLVERDGEFKDVFDEDDVAPKVREKQTRAALKADPDAAAWHLEAAERAFDDGDDAAAEAALARAVALDENAAA